MTEASSVRISGAKKWYGNNLAVKGISLDIKPGELVSLLGPSGCGKTTTLRMIAGLETPDEGDIFIAGKRVTDSPPWRRKIGMVFQSYALFPHMSVSQNIAFGLEMQKSSKADTASQVEKVMAVVKLDGMGDRRPSQLSGGQRQRVALARAIVTRPEVLLFDEPLAALDRKLREHMQVEIRQLQQKLGITAVFVTHDQEEALAISDRVVVMNGGEIEQIDTPANIYDTPATRFVADFIGTSNLLTAIVDTSDAVSANISIGGKLLNIPVENSYAKGAKVDLCLRPENIQIAPDAGQCDFVLNGQCENVSYMGASSNYFIRLETGDTVTAAVPNNSSRRPAKGEKLSIGWNKADTRVLAG